MTPAPPHRSCTNGVAETAVRRAKEGTATPLVQSGLPRDWWLECCYYLRNVHGKMADGKTAFEKRHGQKFDGPSIPPRTLVEYIAITAEDTSRLHQFGKKTLKGTILGYVLRVVRRWVRRLDDDRPWRFAKKWDATEIHVNNVKFYEVFVTGEFDFLWADANRRIPLRPRPLLIAHGNLEREDAVVSKKTTTRETQKVRGPRMENGFIDIMKNFLWSLTTLVMQIPDPIGIRRRNETNSDEYKQCLWTYYPWFVVRSEWCHSLWEVDWDHKIPSLTYKTSCKIQVGEWKTYENPKGYQTRACGLKLGQEFPRNKKKTILQKVCGRKCPNCKQHVVIKKCERFLQGQCWRSCETGKRYRSCIAVHWEGWQPRATAGGCNFSWCQWKTVNFRTIQNTQEKMKRQHMDHIAETGHMVNYHVRLVHKPVSVQEAMEMPEAKAATDKYWT